MPTVGLSDPALHTLAKILNCNSMIPAFVGDLVLYPEILDAFYANTQISNEFWDELTTIYHFSDKQREIVERLRAGEPTLKPLFQQLHDAMMTPALLKQFEDRGACWPCQ